MDFEVQYSTELEQFRTKLQTWIKDNVPEEMKMPVDAEDLSPEMESFWKSKHRDIAAQGWLYPTMPKEYGGGGLSMDHDSIIREEFKRSRIMRANTAEFVLAALLVWGTEEQKQEFLIPLLTAQKTAAQGFTEPQSGSDLANIQSNAIRDGDDWLITGTKCFNSSRVDPDLIYGPIMTDPDAPRHRNLGFFIIPNHVPGVVRQPMPLINGRAQHFLFMEDVRVPGANLIGGDHQGWQVAQTSLESEHGGSGMVYDINPAVEHLLDYVHDVKQNGGAAPIDLPREMVAIDSYIDVHVDRLMAKRTYWMYQNHIQAQWEGIVANVHNRESGLRNMGRLREVLGMHCMVSGKDPASVLGGAAENYQRSAFVMQHGAGSLNIAKVIAARRIGISRTQERAAATPASTAAAS
jgi:alkylation response protein AidB-like acyl-CoA dehydrogenase